MIAFILPATNNTPSIYFEPHEGRFEITGISVPENASEFYQPVYEWMAAHLPLIAKGSVFHFRLTYFNSTSLKAVFQLLKHIKDANAAGANIIVRWYAEEEDEFMHESADMFKDLLDMEIEVHEVPADQGTRRPA
jgi:hypothetical protein